MLDVNVRTASSKELDGFTVASSLSSGGPSSSAGASGCTPTSPGEVSYFCCRAGPLTSPSLSDPSSGDQLWLDPEEVVVRRRLPAAFPKRHVDIYITNKTHPKAQLDRQVHAV